MLDRTTFLIKEQVALLKFVDRYDIYAPETGQPIGFAKEKVHWFTHLLRLLVNKQMLPTRVEVFEKEGCPALLAIRRGITLFRSRVHVLDQKGEEIGYFKSKILSLGGGFYVYDRQDRQVAEIKGDWKGWNFKMLAADGRELGAVTKKWAGLGKELFTSADNYVIALAEGTPSNPGLAALLLAAGLAIDIVFKEQ